MGGGLGTQCMRCGSCQQTKEIEVGDFVNGNLDDIAQGMRDACPHCRGTAFISCYGNDVPKLKSVVGTIRQYSGYTKPIKCLNGGGTRQYVVINEDNQVVV
uniref:Uncharacterized protein n=1 Tax=Noctiluca scintillans TaxID=2966 RepID=A0A6T8REC3_NOCSC|mmetsp:Transcript_10973/g.30366  ORF Transcript_10973/g.30366 Transcript_10973/m.30366 type:complete len:101 (+) Transcript_10973:59-361(+)|eukprot:CAMPEP_0194486408 /NCGR_PEP_ID=MMETSP0253-20130528/7074_1 /TAXON_ID=2966 /ORGANISM="Noctiluca scintillans" /LENGTH=100 /DNA_ID=CAMNT_0039326497 /DNA_START=56 /DNA_END=358 /DNA_ORIENTATION=-